MCDFFGGRGKEIVSYIRISCLCVLFVTALLRENCRYGLKCTLFSKLRRNNPKIGLKIFEMIIKLSKCIALPTFLCKGACYIKRVKFDHHVSKIISSIKLYCYMKYFLLSGLHQFFPLGYYYYPRMVFRSTEKK